MIQAGTISTGSAWTVRVVGAYWISSISRLRNTTLPGVTATRWPTRIVIGADRFAAGDGALPVLERS